jgi:hypothetical protein
MDHAYGGCKRVSGMLEARSGFRLWCVLLLFASRSLGTAIIASASMHEGRFSRDSGYLREPGVRV